LPPVSRMPWEVVRFERSDENMIHTYYRLAEEVALVIIVGSKLR